MPNPHSGANRLIIDKNEEKKEGLSQLNKDLLNANEVAAKALKSALKGKKK